MDCVPTGHLAHAPSRHAPVTEVSYQQQPLSLLADAKGDRDDLAPLTVAGDYVVIGKLASGGCGTVYRAEHRVLGRRVALKVLHRDMLCSQQMVEQFVREARSMSALSHPNIVDVFAFGKLADGRPYYVMELLEGIDLECELRAQGRFSPHAALEVLEQVCAALQAAHDAGVVHRDVKTSNIFLAYTAAGRHVKLLDFGIAKLLEADGDNSLTSASWRVGTPSSMAPEQIRGELVDARTDVYSLGVLAFELLTGRLPFDGPSPDETERLHLYSPAPPLSRYADVAPEVEAVVLRAIEKIPARRFQSARDFGVALRRAVRPARSVKPGESADAEAVALLIDVDLGVRTGKATDGSHTRAAFEFVEAAACEVGWQVVARDARHVLLACLLPPCPEEARLLREESLSMALSFHEALAQDFAGARRLSFRVCVHAAAAIVRSEQGSARIVGGPLLDTDAWAAGPLRPSISATRDALVNLAGWVGDDDTLIRHAQLMPLRRPA